MKRIVIVGVIIGTLLLCACSNAKSIGVIGGADGPTNIIASENKDYKAMTEKEPVKVVRIDGCLYYETGQDSDIEARCGTLDGNFEKTVDAYEIPQNDNEANFEFKNKDYCGYQAGTTEDAIEIPIDDDWEIFKRIETNADISKYKYCYILEGTLPNAQDDSEYLVLANDMNITFEEAANKIFGSGISKDIYVLPIVD